MGGYKLHKGNINKMFFPTGDVGRWHRAATRRVHTRIRAGSPVDSGRLRASWRVRYRRPEQHLLTGTVYTNVKYAPYVIGGTGIYAGRGYITPRRRKYLRFRGRDGRWVYARRVRGQRPNNFPIRALLSLGPPWRIKVYQVRRPS